MILKKYFRVITKPFALTALFFIVVIGLYLTFAPFVISGLPARMRTHEDTERELARLSSLGSFLAGVLRGDFGISAYTGHPVSEDLGPRLQVTLLLVGISIALSVIMAMIVILIALLWKPATRKPQTFAHSLRGYLFGLIPFLSLILMMVFWVKLGLLPGFGLYPSEWAIYPPQSLVEEIVGRLSHLVLPSLSLGLILLARAVMVTWSGASSITSESWPKRILFAFGTIDFAFIISSVVLVEQGFNLPGIGSFFINSIYYADYNLMMGAFITLLAVTVALGCASCAIDFLLRFSGLQSKLEAEVTEPSRSEKQNERLGKKAKGTLLGLLKRKGFVTGSVVIVVFVLLGIFAPLMSPHDPVHDIEIAADLAKPSWLPPLLGQNYSTNMNPIEDPGFNQGSISLSYWNMTADPEITYYYDSSNGRSDGRGSGPGCLSLVFSRTPQGASYGQAIFRMNHTFNYDQTAPPKRFMGTMAWKVETITAGSSYVARVRMKTPISSFDLYESATSNEGTGSSWLTPWPPIDSYGGWSRDLAREIFQVKGTYTYSLEIAFQNTYSSADTPTMRVELDDADFKTLGDTFGLFGTDARGGDIWGQLVYGARTIFITTLPLAALAALVGFGFGFASGYFQGWADNVIMIFVDAMFFIPAFPFLLVLMILPVSNQLFSLILISLLLFSAIAAYGFRNVYLMRPRNKFKGTALRDVIPIVAKDLVVGFSLIMMSLVLVLLATEFLGLFNPAVPSWGGIIYDAWNVPGAFERWWSWLPPLIFAVLLAFGFYLFGSSLDERLE